jgi:CrcB protein
MKAIKTNNMKLLLSIALGGALGSLSRYGVSHLTLKYFDIGFPWGTFIVNVLGSFFIGLIAFYFAGKVIFTPVWQGFLVIGFLGAFTTFSTFSLQTLELFQNNHWHLAIINMILNLILCITAVYAGAGLGKFLA